MPSYDDLNEYYDDFRFLKEFKSELLKQVTRLKADENAISRDELTSGFYTKLQDGREVRIIMPRGLQAVNDYIEETTTENSSAMSNSLGFVGFCGVRSQSVNEENENEAWKLDSILVKEVANIEGMVAYVTGPRALGDEYGNLVLFRDWGVVQNLLKSCNHARAVSSLSPRYYSQVRIHSGILQEGLTSSYFVLQKTLFLFFTLPPEDPRRRHVHVWKTCWEESDDVKVLPEKSCPAEQC